MHPPPAVSVVLCFLNEEQFLGEAVESVAAQTMPDWELWLVDDGSTDGSTAIARRLAQANPERVFYIDHLDHRNLGLSASRNVGIAHARSRYVAFLDADDAWLPRKLEEQTAILDRYPNVAMVVGASTYWRSWTGAPGAIDVVVPIGADQDTAVLPPTLMTRLYPLGDGAGPPPSDIMLRREVLRGVNGFEPSFQGPLMLYEDQALLSKVYRGHKVYVSSACWDRYRMRPESLVAKTTAAGHYWQVRLHFLNWLKRDLQRTGPVGEDVDVALGRAIQRARAELLVDRTKHVARQFLPASIYDRLRQQWRGSA